LINPESWIKVDDKPFMCNIEPILLLKNKMSVFLTDGNLSYTATLRFEKTELLLENIYEIKEGNNLPDCMTDYEFLCKIYKIKTQTIDDWQYKCETDRFNFIIDYLLDIFKEEKDK
jgi:hypothetical protein